MKISLPDLRLSEAERLLQYLFRFNSLWQAIGVGLAVLLASVGIRRELPNQPGPPRMVMLQSQKLALEGLSVAPLRVVAAWQLKTDDRRFGGLSALAIDHGRFLAMSDSSVLFRFPVPRPGVTVAISELPDGPGPREIKVSRDSESLSREALGRGWLVGFETRDQVWLYDRNFKHVLNRIAFRLDRWKRNVGIEAMVSDRTGPMLIPEPGHEVVTIAGATATSRPLDSGGARISDAARLPGGEVLVLMRTVTLTGIKTALGVLVDHPAGWRIDRKVALNFGIFANLEGLAVQPLPGGGARLWLVSDDNFQLPMTTMLIAIDVGPGPWPGANR